MRTSDAESRAIECRRLWEAEAELRSKLGARSIELEQATSDAKTALAKEEKRVSKAVEKKRQAEERADAMTSQVTMLQTQVAELTSSVKRAKQKIRSAEKQPSMHGGTGATESATVTRLQEDLQRETTMRLHALQLAAGSNESALTSVMMHRSSEADVARSAMESELIQLRSEAAAQRLSTMTTQTSDRAAQQRHQQLGCHCPLLSLDL